MVYFGDSIAVKNKGTLYCALRSGYNYCWSENFNMISKIAVLHNIEIGGIWDGSGWAYRDDRNAFKLLLRKYHNVQIR